MSREKKMHPCDIMMEPTVQEQPSEPEDSRRLWLLALLFDSRISMRRYILRAGLISIVPSAIFVSVLAGLGILNEETGPEFEGPAVLLLISVVIIGPVMETLLMGPVLRLLSLVTKRKVRLAIMSAFVWAGLHSMMAPAWGLGVLWPFFVFSCSYLNWRQISWRRAVLVTSCVHAFQNFLPGLLVVATQ